MILGSYPVFNPAVVLQQPRVCRQSSTAEARPKAPSPSPGRNGALAADRLAAMGQQAIASAHTAPPKMNPFIGFRANMARLRESGVVSVPRV